MSDMTVQRNASGQLLPGSRLNPGGRPARAIEDIRERLLPYMAESVEALVELMRSPNGHLRLAAIHEYYDRLLGKPPVAVDSTVTRLDLGEAYLRALQLVNRPIDVAPADEPADQTDQW
jgi:hypothetical protein